MAYKEMDEGRLLRPHGMKLEKAGEWPCFELTDAEVTSPVDGSMQNLLLAGTGSQLFQARGLLKSPGEDNRASYRSAFKRPELIRIGEVALRSYGLSEDNEVQLWAGGRSGWFEISPSAAYQAMYDLMAQAVQLYFFFLDELQGPQKKMQKSFTLRTALSMFAEQHKEPEADVSRVLRKNKAFFLHEMEKGEGDIKWRRTRLYKDLGAFGSATSIQAKPDLPRIQALKIGKRDGSRSSSESGRSKRERDEEEDLQARKRSWPAAKRLPFDALDESIMIIDSDSEADVGRPTRRPMRPRPTKTRAPPPPEFEMEEEEEEISGDMPQRASRATDRLNEQISATSGSAHPGAAPNGTSGYSVRPTTLADKHDANVDEYELVHLQPHATDAEIWSCPACPYKVLDAQETSGQREIADHRLGHENDVLEQVMTLDAEELQLQASTKYLREAILKAARMNHERRAGKVGMSRRRPQKAGTVVLPQRVKRSGY